LKERDEKKVDDESSLSKKRSSDNDETDRDTPSNQIQTTFANIIKFYPHTIYGRSKDN
jgi:hypothetical protein